MSTLSLKKANSTRAFLSRNLRHCSHKIKESAYNTLVRPTVEYASVVWDTHTQHNSKKVEQVQRNAARFVTGIYDRTRSVSAILQELNWQSLQDRRTSSRLAMMYKIRYGLVDIEWNQYLVHLSTSTRGHKSLFVIPHTKSTVFTNSFFPRTIRDWNSLAVDPAEYKSLEAFKLALKAHPSK